MERPTLSDLARQAGCSKNTVSNALRGTGRVAKATRTRILRLAAGAGYRPNSVLSEVMAQLRTGELRQAEANLGVVNANRDRHAFTRHPTVPTYLAGVRRRAAALGYGVEEFWLYEPGLRAKRWEGILRARGVRGLVLVGLMDKPELPRPLRGIWDRFPTIATGVRTRDPALSFACVDHHRLALTAFEQALRLGYRRPALVLDDVIDRLVERRFSAGFMTAQRNQGKGDALPIFGHVGAGRDRPDLFRHWLSEHRPDIVFTLYHAIIPWIEAAGWRIPRDLALAQFEWRAARPEIAGMNQHNDVAGEAAVDMVVSQLRSQERGVPEFPRATLIGASWVNGPSAPARSSRR